MSQVSPGFIFVISLKSLRVLYFLRLSYVFAQSIERHIRLLRGSSKFVWQG